MKRIWKACLMVLILFASLVAVSVASADATGVCGDNLTWTLSDAGVLTISGTGDMDWLKCSWRDSQYEPETSIKRVVIENGVTSIAYGAFTDCSSLRDISIPTSVKTIGGSGIAAVSRRSRSRMV